MGIPNFPNVWNSLGYQHWPIYLLVNFSFADNLIENLCQNHAHLSDQQVENGERIFYFKPAKMNNVSMVIG